MPAGGRFVADETKPAVPSSSVELVRAYVAAYPRGLASEVTLDSFPAGEAILALAPADQIQIIHATLSGEAFGDSNWARREMCDRLRGQLARRALPYTSEDIDLIAQSLRRTFSNHWGADNSMLSVLEKWKVQQPLSEVARSALEKLRSMAESRGSHSNIRKLISRLDGLLNVTDRIRIVRGEAWSDVAKAELQSMSDPQRTNWAHLISHCADATGSKPSAKWSKLAKELIGAVGIAEFKVRMLIWLPLVEKPRTSPLQVPRHSPDPNLLLEPGNADVLKGLAWCCVEQEDTDIARAVMRLALTAYKKVPGVGPRAISLGNACLYTLGHMPGMDGVAQLALLKVRVRFGTAQKLIEKAFVETATRLGMSRDDVEEMSVPSYGLEEVGLHRETLGEFTAQLAVTTEGSDLQFLKADGKPAKSVPAAIKQSFAEDLKDLKQAAKDIDAMLPAQRERIDSLFLEQKTWLLETWRQRYLDHPLVGVIGRRLIWRFTRGAHTADAIFLDGTFVTRDDKPVDWLDAETTVQLWHPLDRNTEEIIGWRDWLERQEVRQPFKQAHREIYILTDAERNTAVYSNRYAAHIIRQHQFNALCAARGWKNKLRLSVDDEYPPTIRVLPKWNLRAEFWVEGVGEYGTDTNESGVYLRLATDQVRFYPIDAPQRAAHASGGGYAMQGQRADDQPIPLDQVPPLVLSEIMRDVDLFVGVASIGNDPNWQDGGRETRFGDYWQNYSFGDLGATAKTRKTVLEKLVPRLKIAPRCSFDDKFLIVRGELRTYKIHLGSGNILMEPNDQYLCIVAARSARGAAAGKADGAGVFLPFDGDERLSIILSKALMLADDTKIKDETITRQIKSK